MVLQAADKASIDKQLEEFALNILASIGQGKVEEFKVTVIDKNYSARLKVNGEYQIFKGVDPELLPLVGDYFLKHKKGKIFRDKVIHVHNRITSVLSEIEVELLPCA